MREERVRFSHLDRLLTQSAEDVAPTLVCRVEEGGNLLFEGGYGWLNPASRSRPTPTGTLFDLASLTKLFTATAFLRLVEQGKVQIDQPVAAVMPEFAGLRAIGGTEDPLTKRPLPADPRWSGEMVDAGTVTFRHLLTHTSGLPAWRSLYRICGPLPAPEPPQPAEIADRHSRALDAITGFPFIYPPGQDYVYSDIGLILLGFAVERLYGAGLDRTIRELVCTPLGIGACFNPDPALSSRIAATEEDPWRMRRLRGEVHDENAAGLGGVAGHAGLFGEAADLCRLGQLYLRGGRQLLSPELVAESTRQHYVSRDGVRRGLGWLLRSDPDSSCSSAFSLSSFGHTGFTGTSLWCDPERDLVVVLLTNRVYYGRSPQGISALRPKVHQLVIEGLGESSRD
jgi:serine-type D-Ala-D-Ala carboxypeptidase